MDEYWELKKLSLKSFSSSTIPLVYKTLKIIQLRYPKVIPHDSSPEHWVDTSWQDESEPCRFQCLDDEWSIFASLITNFPTDYAGITSDILNLRGGGALEADIVTKYIGLLGMESSLVKILEPRPLQKEVNHLGDVGIDFPTIIPFKDDGAWAFAVAYTDCIHWYDSGPGRPVPKFSDSSSRPTMDNWTGPKQEHAEDSGIYMLLGIRCVLEGLPHLTDHAANIAVSSFRDRMLIELLCKKVDPTHEEFQNLRAERPGDERALFVSDQNQAESESPIYTSGLASPPHTVHVRSRLPRRISRQGTLNQRELATSSPQRINSPSPRPQPVEIIPNDRKIILCNLNDAVLATRIMGSSSSSDLVVLWNFVKKQTLRSTFIERYNSVLFYDRMSELHTDEAINIAMHNTLDKQSIKDMKRMQAQCKFWRDVCGLREQWGTSKYSLLLAFADIGLARLQQQKRHSILSAFKSRLQNGNDPLESSLEKARDLTAAVVNRSLPAERLMIDLYHLREQENLTDALYNAFTSVDPRAKLPLPHRIARR